MDEYGNVNAVEDSDRMWGAKGDAFFQMNSKHTFSDTYNCLFN